MKKLSLRRGKDIFLGFCLSGLVLNGTTFASTISEMIEVYYTGITVYIDGVKTPVKDSTGADTEPFIYNGTTYVPLAFISQSLGQPVQWDGTTKSIYIGQSTAHNTYLLDVCPPYQTSGSVSATDGSEIFKMAGNSYTNGLVAYFSAGAKSELIFNLDGKYDSLHFLLGHVDGSGTYDTTVNIYLDGKLVEEIEFSSDMLPKDCYVKLNGALQMKIEFTSTTGGVSGRKYGLAEMIVS